MEGLRWAVQWGVPQAIVESDCAQIVAKMGNVAEDRSELSTIINEAKGLALLLNSWKISKVNRDGK